MYFVLPLAALVVGILLIPPIAFAVVSIFFWWERVLKRFGRFL